MSTTIFIRETENNFFVGYAVCATVPTDLVPPVSKRSSRRKGGQLSTVVSHPVSHDNDVLRYAAILSKIARSYFYVGHLLNQLWVERN